MKRNIRNHLIVGLLLAVLCSYMFFFKIGSSPLTDPDETFYAQTAKEMGYRGEWVTPYLYGEPQFEKPILIYWLVEVSYRIFGINEFAARLPSAILAFIGVLAMYLLGTALFNRRVGIFSAVILATNVEYVILSKACVTDMALCAFMMLGVLFFFYGQIKGKGRYYILSSAAFAIATLAKGPIAILLAGASIGLYLLLAKEMRTLKKIPFIPCALVFIAVAGPWYCAMYKLHGNTFIDAFFGFQNVTRFMQSEHKIGSQFYYNIPIVFGGFFPWSVFLPLGLWLTFKRALQKDIIERKHSIFVLSWFFTIFIFFSASSTKLPTYIFPCFISLALMAGMVWGDYTRKIPGPGASAGMRYSFYLLSLVMVFGAAGAFIYVKGRYPDLQAGVAISSAFLIFGIGLSLVAYMRKMFIGSFLFIVYAVALFLYPMNTLILPELERHETSKEIAGILSGMMKAGEKLASESNYRAGLAFYTGIFPSDIDKHHNLVRFMSSSERVWCVLKEKNHKQLYELDTKPFYTSPSYMVYKLGKKCIVTNKVPDDGKYLVKRERIR